MKNKKDALMAICKANLTSQAEPKQPAHTKGELQHTQGEPSDKWNTRQYADYYNRIIKELNFPTINKAGDPSCYVQNRNEEGGIYIVLHCLMGLIELPIGGCYHYLRQIELAQRIVKCCNNEWKIDMHDELIEALTISRRIIQKHIDAIKEAETSDVSRVVNQTYLSDMSLINDVLQKAEQK